MFSVHQSYVNVDPVISNISFKKKTQVTWTRLDIMVVSPVHCTSNNKVNVKIITCFVVCSQISLRGLRRQMKLRPHPLLLWLLRTDVLIMI